jgi:hypothetical protein
VFQKEKEQTGEIVGKFNDSISKDESCNGAHY